MYFPYFVAYIVAGLTVSLALFFWGLRNGQFQDQQRARYLPLRGETGRPAAPAHASRLKQWELYALFLLAVGGLAASAGVLLYAIYFR